MVEVMDEVEHLVPVGFLQILPCQYIFLKINYKSSFSCLLLLLFKRLASYSLSKNIPWRRVWQPTLIFLPGEIQGSLFGYSSWVTKSLTQLSDWHFHFKCPMGFQVAQTVKDLPVVQRRGFDPWVRKVPWR